MKVYKGTWNISDILFTPSPHHLASSPPSLNPHLSLLPPLSPAPPLSLSLPSSPQLARPFQYEHAIALQQLGDIHSRNVN